MDYTEGSSDGIYLPMKLLFEAPIYERAQQVCWNAVSFKRQVTLMVEFLQLHRSNQLPTAMTVEDVLDLMKEMEQVSLRVQLWQFELEEYKNEPEVLTLLDLVWHITVGLKFRDVEFEARRILDSPDLKTSAAAEQSSRKRAEKWQRPSSSNPLTPKQAVLQLVPKVVQHLWQPHPDTDVTMPSQHLTHMAVGLTKAVEDHLARDLASQDVQSAFSRANRDAMVLSIQDTVGRIYARDVLEERLSLFAPELLRLITRLAADAVRQHFEPQPDRGGSTESQESGLEEDEIFDSWDDVEGDSLPATSGSCDSEDSACPPAPTDLADWYVGTPSCLYVGADASALLRSIVNRETTDSDYYAYAGTIKTMSQFPMEGEADARNSSDDIIIEDPSLLVPVPLTGRDSAPWSLMPEPASPPPLSKYRLPLFAQQ